MVVEKEREDVTGEEEQDKALSLNPTDETRDF